MNINSIIIMINGKYVTIWAFLIFILCCVETKNDPKLIPVEQFKVHNFTDEIWHPHFSKSKIDDKNFVIVDNYREHLRNKKNTSRLQSNPSGNVGLKKVIDSNFYDNDMTPDTLLPGQNSTEKGPFNCACKFTLSDAPKIDSNNYSTLVSQGGSVDEGMLGEYVTLYDTKEDTKDPNTVTTSQTNQADPGRKESRVRQLNNNSTKLQTGLSRSEETNNLQPTSNNNNAQAFSNVIQQNYAPQARIQNMQPNYYPQNTNPQVVYVPVASNYQNPNPINLQYTAQMGSNVMYQPVYTQPVQQAPAQVVYMNGQAYTLQPVGQQYAQANYLQSPLPMNNAMNMQPAYANVGNGLNQVPTLIY